MRKDRMGDVALRAKAALKDALGKVTGDKKLQAEAAAERAAIQVRSTTCGIKPGQRARTRSKAPKV